MATATDFRTNQMTRIRFGKNADRTSVGGVTGVNRNSGLAVEITLDGYLPNSPVTR